MEMNAIEYSVYMKVTRMITESGEMWRESCDRAQPNSEVIICEQPHRAFYLTWVGNVEGNVNGWAVEMRPIQMDHAREFFAAFGSHYDYWINATMQGGHVVRAYIKNGRKPDWTISIEPCV